jgi:hypothetical protein
MAGYLYLSINAGVARLLFPQSQRAALQYDVAGDVWGSREFRLDLFFVL